MPAQRPIDLAAAYQNATISEGVQLGAARNANGVNWRLIEEVRAGAAAVAIDGWHLHQLIRRPEVNLFPIFSDDRRIVEIISEPQQAANIMDFRRCCRDFAVLFKLNDDYSAFGIGEGDQCLGDEIGVGALDKCEPWSFAGLNNRGCGHDESV